jgi:hypothetical protein
MFLGYHFNNFNILKYISVEASTRTKQFESCVHL